jgi:hypothetical protein
VRGADVRGQKLLLSLIRQRSIQGHPPVENVLQSGISRPLYGLIGQARWSLTLGACLALSFAAVERSMSDRLLGQANEVPIGTSSRPA